jgi:hypothetical protein
VNVKSTELLGVGLWDAFEHESVPSVDGVDGVDEVFGVEAGAAACSPSITSADGSTLSEAPGHGEEGMGWMLGASLEIFENSGYDCPSRIFLKPILRSSSKAKGDSAIVGRYSAALE